MARVLRILGRMLERLDFVLSWWERLAKMSWVRWGVSAVTLWAFHFWAALEGQPLIVLVTVMLGATAFVTVLFTFLPSLLRKLTSSPSKPSFPQRRWVQIANHTNAELQQEALETVRLIRDCLEQYKRDEHLQYTPMFPQGASAETKNLLHDQNFQEIAQRSNHFMANYKKQFLVNVILLRDELKRRVPDTEEETNEFYIKEFYEHPVNSLCVETVTNNLERLAKRLSP